MQWKQKATIKLSVGPEHLVGWNEDKVTQLLGKVRRMFSLSECNSDIKVEIKTSRSLNLEFTVRVTDCTISAMSIVESMERLFFDINVGRRDITYERF